MNSKFVLNQRFFNVRFINAHAYEDYYIQFAQVDGKFDVRSSVDVGMFTGAASIPVGLSEGTWCYL